MTVYPSFTDNIYQKTKSIFMKSLFEFSKDHPSVKTVHHYITCKMIHQKPCSTLGIIDLVSYLKMYVHILSVMHCFPFLSQWIVPLKPGQVQRNRLG